MGRVIRVLLALMLLGAVITVEAPSAFAAPSAGDGQVVLEELQQATGPGTSNSPTSTFFTTTDADGLPDFPIAPTSGCTQAASPGLFPQLNDEGRVLPCGGNSPNSQREWLTATGMLIIPEGTTSLTLRAKNELVDGEYRQAWFGFWSAEGPDPSSMVERGFGPTRYRVLETIDVPVPIPQQCANPHAVAFRVYVYDNGTLFGYQLQWSLDGGGFVDVPPANVSTIAGTTFEDLDGDGIEDYKQLDTDGDGIDDWTEMGESLAGSTLDSDGDGSPDCDDTDSDDDGTPDGVDGNRATPAAVDDDVSVVAGQTTATIDVLANDDFVADPGTPGRIVVTDLGTGSAPPANYTLDAATGEFSMTTGVDDENGGPYTVDYQVCHTVPDPDVCGTATITVTVTDDADATANDDGSSTPNDRTPVVVDWDDNDDLVDGATLGDVDTVSVGGGAVADNGDGTFTYTPALGFAGTDTFTYRLCDDDVPTATCSQATVSVDVGLEARIGAAKALPRPLTDNGDGTFTAAYLVRIENLGNEDLVDVVVTDSLADFGSIGSVAVASADVAVNPGFDGVGDTTLAGPFPLTVGEVVEITVDVVSIPTPPDTIDNQVEVTATGTMTGDVAADLSNDGAVADTDGDGIADTPAENVPTSFDALTDVPWNPVLDVTKTVAGSTHEGGGLYATTYTITITNTGNEPIDGFTAADPITGYPGLDGVSLDQVVGATANPDYDGVGDADLLDAPIDLDPGDTVTATVTVRYRPVTDGSVTNTATVEGTSRHTGATLTPSDDATVGFATDLPLTLDVEVTKTLDVVVDNGDGSFTATYTTAVENTGTERAAVEVSDPVASVFPAGSTIAVLGSTGDVVHDPAFGGDGRIELLDAGTVLEPGGSGTVTYTVTFVPDDLSTITNTATADATGTISGTVGSDADTADLTAAMLGVAPGLDADKSVAAGLVDHGDGTFSATFTITVVNDGNEAVTGLQVDDDLAAAFPAGYVVTGPASAELTVNPGFDGDADPTLLAGTDTLAVGASATVTFDVRWTPDRTAGVDNTATASGTGTVSGQVVAETTAVATTPDPALTTSVGAAKDSTLTDNGDGTFTATYLFTVANLGTETVESVQLTDDLVTAFGPGFTIDSLTAPTLTVNPGYDGDVDPALLAGTDSLAVGASETVTLVMTWAPTLPLYVNQAEVTAIGSVTGVGAVDLSDAGTDPDSDGDRDPSGPGEDDPTPVSPDFDPSVATTKSVDPVLVDHGDGTFTAGFTIGVVNDGNEPLVGVQVVDDLASVFPAGFVVSGLSSAEFSVDPGFDGDADTALLSGADALAVGASGSVSFDVTWTPDSTSGVANVAVGSAMGAVSGVTSTDVAGPTSTPSPALSPSLVASKAASSTLVDNGDGTFTTTWAVSITNDGNEPLVGVQVVDDLASVFPAGFVVSGLSSPDLTVNPGFDGDGDPALLDGSDSLAVGAIATVAFDVTWTPDSSTGVVNVASASGSGAVSGSPATDDSDPASTPDPALSPGVDTTKTADPTLVDNGDGTFTASWTIGVTNDGNEPLVGVQVVDDLASVFPVGFVVSGLSSPDLSVNPGFDGDADQSLLVGTDTLAVGATGSVSFDVTWTPDSATGVSNVASGSGSGAVSGLPTTDDSDPATTTGPDLDASLAVSKSADPVLVDNGDGTFTAGFTVGVVNDGNESLVGVQVVDDLVSVFPAGFVVSGLSSADLTVNPGFDGDADTELLTGADALAVGGSGSVSFDVTWTPDSTAGIANVASVEAVGSLSGVPAVDDSDPATTPDPALAPSLEVLKSADPVLADNGDGTFTTTWTVTVTNDGNEPLVGVQVLDDLVSVFPAGFVVSGLSSADLTVNPGFDGDADTELLVGTDTLAVGASGSVSFAVTWTPDSTTGVTNVATAEAIGSVSGLPTTDGTEPATTPDPELRPSLTVSKAAASTLVDNGDGTFSVTWAVGIRNDGNTDLLDVQLVDDLAARYPAGFEVSGLASVDLTVDPAFDGRDTTTLLAGTDSLPVGAFGTVTFDVTWTPDGTDGIVNVADATAVGAVDGSPVEASSPAAVSPSPTLVAELGTTKELVGDIDDRGDGRFAATFRLEVRNAGNQPLESVQLVDALGDLGDGPIVEGIEAEGLTVNPDYDGVDVTALLDGSDRLAVGASGSIELAVVWTADGDGSNRATATASGAIDGVVAVESSTVAVEPPFTATVDIDKTVVEVTAYDDGSVDLTYRITVRNTSNQPLDQVQIVDDGRQLGELLGGSVVAADSLTPATGFDPLTGDRLLAGTDTLAPGATGWVEVRFRVVPTSPEIVNQAAVSGVGQFRDTVAGVLSASVPASVPGRSLSGQVWFDADRDGRRDPGEGPVEGVTVTLVPIDVIGVDGEPLPPRTILTDADGRYWFGGLPVGRYRIVVDPDRGVLTGPANAGVDDTLDSDVDPTVRSTAVLTLDGRDCPSRYVCETDQIDAGVWWGTDDRGAGDDGTPGVLAFTGSSTGRLALGGLSALAVGWWLVLAGRRRHADA